MDNTNKNQNTSAEQKTIEYYNSKAEEFYESTVNADMSDQYYLFEKYLGDGAHIVVVAPEGTASIFLRTDLK